MFVSPQSSASLLAYLSVCTGNFAGREWVFEAIDDWLTRKTSRFFMIIGQPGSGKTTLCARLIEFNDRESGVVAPSTTHNLQPGFLSGYHFCRMQDYHLINPYSFSQELAGQLRRHPAFGEVYQEKLRAYNGNRPLAEIVQRIGSVAAGAQITGLSVGSLYLSGLSPEDAFDRLVHAPLTDTLKDERFKEMPVIIVVDGLDEALQFRRDINIVSLLSSIRYLPTNVRFLVTTSPRNEVTDRLAQSEQQVQQLWLDAADGLRKSLADVSSYLRSKLAQDAALAQVIGPDCSQESFVNQIRTRSQANFLYLHHLLERIVQAKRPLSADDLETLPSELSDVYRNQLRTLTQQDPTHWQETLQALGMLSVGQELLPESLLAQLVGKTRSDLRRMLVPYESLLPFDPQAESKRDKSGERQYTFYHPSFSQFLQDGTQAQEFWIEAAEQHAHLADYFASRFQGFWGRADPYGLRYTAIHYINAAEGCQEQPRRHQLVERLVEVVLDQTFQATHCRQINNVAVLRQLLEMTLDQTVRDNPIDPTHALVNVVRMALAFNRFREAYLQPRDIFAHARRGDMKVAQDRLALYPVDQRWIDVACLLIAWLAHPRVPTEAQEIIDGCGKHTPADPIVSLLIDRVAPEVVGVAPSALPPLPQPLSDSTKMDALVQGIVRRMGGLQVDLDVSKLCQELVEQVRGGIRATLGKDRDREPVYVAEEDGPVLVAYVKAWPEKGERQFKRYLRLHATTPDRHYREESLWLLMDSVLRHPDRLWVQESLIQIVTEALSGQEVTFQEGVRRTLYVLKANTAPDKARVAFEDMRLTVLIEAAEAVIPEKAGDLWGFHKRRLACLAEALHCLRQPIDPIWSRLPTLILNIACALVTPENAPNFAGYRALAQLLLAETVHICHLEEVWPRQGRLAEALKAAHNIRHPSFCARMTARVNAVSQWWSDADQADFDLEKQISQLLKQSTSAKAVAGVHFIGEAFKHREGPETNKPALPPDFYRARSLRSLLDVYGLGEKDLPRLRGLNQAISRTPNQKLPQGTQVYVPDSGLVALRACWLAALVLADDQLGIETQIRLMQSLVPLTIDNPTALDTLLSRLLLAAQPADPQILQALEKVIPPLADAAERK